MLQPALPRRRRTALATAIAATLIAAAPGAATAAPSASSAAAGAGAAKVTIGGNGKAAKALRANGVKVVARRGSVSLRVRRVSVARRAQVTLAGAVRLRAGRRAVRLSALRLVVAPRRATITGKVGRGGRITVFRAAFARPRAKLDRSADTARLRNVKLALTPVAARRLQARLGVRGLRAGPVGRLNVNARPRGDSGNPRSGTLENVPPVLARPASAVDVDGISIVWYPRDSWVRYLSSGVGRNDGILARDGATKLPPMEAANHPCPDTSYPGSGTFDFGYRFTPRSGWYDPVTGAAALYGQGSVRFVWKSHTIDLMAANPEIELTGSDARAIFEFTGGGGTDFERQRADVVGLDLTGQPSTVGGQSVYSAIRGRLTENGQSVFAGFYPPPGDGFGCFTVAFNVPS